MVNSAEKATPDLHLTHTEVTSAYFALRVFITRPIFWHRLRFQPLGGEPSKGRMGDLSPFLPED